MLIKESQDSHVQKEFYCIEYRKFKKNVEKFGLKEWFEGVCLLCKGDINSPEEAKVLQNLGKIQDINNSIRLQKKNGCIETRPTNMFTDLDTLIIRGTAKAKYHGLTLTMDLISYNDVDGTKIINHN